MVFVGISEQTAIISLYSNKCLVVVTRTEIDYCMEHSEILPSAHAVHLSILCRFWGKKFYYFAMQHLLINLIKETEIVYCALRN